MPVAGPVLPGLDRPVGIGGDAHRRVKVAGEILRDGNRIAIHGNRRNSRCADLKIFSVGNGVTRPSVLRLRGASLARAGQPGDVGGLGGDAVVTYGHFCPFKRKRCGGIGANELVAIIVGHLGHLAGNVRGVGLEHHGRRLTGSQTDTRAVQRGCEANRGLGK